MGCTSFTTSDGYTYTWEMGRQLAGISGNGRNVSFKYNAEGIRTEKTVGTVTTKYHLVGDKVTFETNGTDTIYYSYDSSDNLISMKLNGAEYYYIRNAQGDIIGLLDGTGNQVVSYTYDSWGKLISIDGSLKDSVGVKNPYRYREGIGRIPRRNCIIYKAVTIILSGDVLLMLMQ